MGKSSTINNRGEIIPTIPNHSDETRIREDQRDRASERRKGQGSTRVFVETAWSGIEKLNREMAELGLVFSIFAFIFSSPFFY